MTNPYTPSRPDTLDYQEWTEGEAHREEAEEMEERRRDMEDES